MKQIDALALCRDYLESDEYKELTAKRQAACMAPEPVPAHEENEWNIEVVEGAQHDEEPPIEFGSAADTVDASELAVADMIAKLEAAQV